MKPRAAALDLALAIGAALAGLLLPALAARWARPAVLNFGPNDTDYVAGFREDWERERRTRFHWTTPSASVHLPVVATGEGHVLRVRARRHLVEPARVTFRTEGRLVGVVDIQADPRMAYRVLEFPLPPLEGRAPFSLTIDSASADPRPLGVALDWLEIERGGSGARFASTPATRAAAALLILLAFAIPRLAGGSRRLAAIHAGAVLLVLTAGAWWDLLATERVLRWGTPVYAVAGLMAVALARAERVRAWLDVPGTGVAGALALLALAALALRLAVLLHPQFYYPDVRVHGMFAWQIARRGLVEFLRDFTENQFRFSLGLQMENGHWYAFPYPPAFYILCWPLVSLARLRPEVAVSVAAAVVNSLEVFVVFALARRLRAQPAVALAAAAAHVVLPLFLARLSLAYFPAMVGHFVDAVVILYVLSHLSSLDRPRVVLTLAGLIGVALLTYTQSLLNLAVLLPLFLVVWVVRDRSKAALHGAAGLAVAGTLGALFSLAVFYGRYVPIFLDMQRGIPMAEERILHEKARSPVPPEELVPEPPDDPYAGPSFDLLRGMRKAAWRLYVFYGPFAPVVAVGIALVYRAQPRGAASFVLAWALTYLALNFLSGSLPGPNLVRYNKDLEIVAPLFCLSLASVGAWLWMRGWWMAVAYAGAYATFGLARAARYLTEKFVLER